jgi:hypothetical protein
MRDSFILGRINFRIMQYALGDTATGDIFRMKAIRVRWKGKHSHHTMAIGNKDITGNSTIFFIGGHVFKIALATINDFLIGWTIAFL